MTFEIGKVNTTVNASKEAVGAFGYFSNDLSSLKDSIDRGRTNLRTAYARLDTILPEKYERRFMCELGAFSLFYPTDSLLNTARY